MTAEIIRNYPKKSRMQFVGSAYGTTRNMKHTKRAFVYVAFSDLSPYFCFPYSRIFQGASSSLSQDSKNVWITSS